MKLLVKILKVIACGLDVLVLFMVGFMACNYVCARITVPHEKERGVDVDVYLYSNGVHTDLVVPVREREMDWSREIKYTNTVGKDSAMQYLAFGWGDKGFYMDTPTWADLKVSTALKAAVGLGGTAIHATYYKTMEVGPECIKMRLSSNQYRRLVHYIHNSFKPDENGHYINIKTNANYGMNDAFYEARGHYTIFYTCNTWTNQALKACGQKASLWTVFESGLFYQYTPKK